MLPHRGARRADAAVLGGLTTAEIARAFLAPEPTIAQRIVRAKRTLAEKHVPFEVPRGDRARRPPRLGARGHLPHLQRGLLGDRRRRLDAAGALRRSAAPRAASWPSSRPHEPEVHGLVALMEIQASRSRARVGPGGEPILLLDQDRARWDQLLIRRGLAALERAGSLGGAPGPYSLQAAIAACHARARTARGDRLGADRRALRGAGGAHAVAGRRAESRRRRRDGIGPAGRPRSGRSRCRRAGAEGLPPAAQRPRRSPPKLGRHAEARAEFERAASMTRNAREQNLLAERARDSAQKAGQLAP